MSGNGMNSSGIKPPKISITRKGEVKSEGLALRMKVHPGGFATTSWGHFVILRACDHIWGPETTEEFHICWNWWRQWWWGWWWVSRKRCFSFTSSSAIRFKISLYSALGFIITILFLFYDWYYVQCVLVVWCVSGVQCMMFMVLLSWFSKIQKNKSKISDHWDHITHEALRLVSKPPEWSGSP